MYNCPKCNIELIRGFEYQFPPRLSYWYCPQCQEVYQEHGDNIVDYIGKVEEYKSLCIQDWDSRGFILNTITGEKSYSESI